MDIYSTAQLQGNVLTSPRHVWMHPVSGEKGHGSYVSFAVALLQDFGLAWMHLMHAPDASQASQMYLMRPRRISLTPDVSCMRFRCASNAFQMCVNVTLKLSCTVLLYYHSCLLHLSCLIKRPKLILF